MPTKDETTRHDLAKNKELEKSVDLVLDALGTPSAWRNVMCKVQEKLAEAEICEVEPLIKDEKIRKAVRAVANITGVSMLFYEYYEDNEMVQLSDMNGQILAFKSKKLSVKDFDSYTITELCGEEENE